MKYLLEDRELNGYDDSDFYAIFYDTETESIRSEIYGSTRFPSPTVAPSSEYIREIPEDVKPKIFDIVYKRALSEIREADRDSIDTPEKVKIGESVTLTQSGTFKDKRSGEKVSFSEGETGVVIWEGCFERIYRNGYNRKGRHNTRVGIKLEDGRVVFVKLEICKLSRAYLTDEEIDERAKRYAGYNSYAALFGMTPAGFALM